MREVMPAIVVDGAPLWAFIIWVAALSAHAVRQPKIRRLLGYNGPVPSGLSILVLLAATLITLGLCIAADPTAGIFYWCGTFSIAGSVTALGLACLQSHR